MTKNTKIFALTLLVMFFGITMCGFANGGDFVTNNGKSIIKNDKINNTFGNFESNYSNNIEVVPSDLTSDELPHITPYTGEELWQEPTENHVFATRNQQTGKVLIEATTGRVLYTSNEDARLYPASTTKILTALCVLDNVPLDKVVEIPKEAVGVEGSSIYLKEGQKISVEDLLFGLMLRSGNDAAVALAISTSGSMEEFAKLMNKTAIECGATDSNFVNPHGLQDENHYTTALDLATITARAYKNQDFVRIVSSKTRKIKIDDSELVIANKNKMLKLYDGANGVKTGFTKSSGRCLVSGAKRDGMQLISVVLNCGDMWNESIRMLDFGFDTFEMVNFEKALLGSGEKTVTFDAKFLNNGDLFETKFPLRKDGSEKIAL